MHRAIVFFALIGCGGIVEAAPMGVESDASNDARSTSDASDAGDDRVMPIELGRHWVFDVSAIGAGTATCALGETTVSVLGASTVNGQPALRYRPLCAAFDVDIVGMGERLVAYRADDPATSWLYIDTPIEDGHEWQIPAGSSVVWRDAGAVTVRAGTFQNCWRREDVGAPGNNDITYCRGIGQVSFHSVAGGWKAELVSKSF